MRRFSNVFLSIGFHLSESRESAPIINRTVHRTVGNVHCNFFPQTLVEAPTPPNPTQAAQGHPKYPQHHPAAQDHPPSHLTPAAQNHPPLPVSPRISGPSTTPPHSSSSGPWLSQFLISFFPLVFYLPMDTRSNCKQWRGTFCLLIPCSLHKHSALWTPS